MATDDLVEHFQLHVTIGDDDREHIVHHESGFNERWLRKAKLGRGVHGDVWKYERVAEHRSADMSSIASILYERAVKVIDKKYNKRELTLEMKREILALCELSKMECQKSEAFVNFYGWYQTESSLYLGMEYIQYGDLGGHIRDIMTEDEMKDITRSLLRGLDIMHQQGFTHRDLKPANIFVSHRPPNSRWKVKIGDFGISKRVSGNDTELRTNIGTPLYQAPEILAAYRDHSTLLVTPTYDNSVDMWSLGCVLYEIVAQRPPFVPYHEAQTYALGKRSLLDLVPLKDSIGKSGVDFVVGLLHPEPKIRMNVTGAQRHEWLAEESLVTGPSEPPGSMPSGTPQGTTPEPTEHVQYGPPEYYPYLSPESSSYDPPEGLVFRLPTSYPGGPPASALQPVQTQPPWPTLQSVQTQQPRPTSALQSVQTQQPWPPPQSVQTHRPWPTLQSVHTQRPWSTSAPQLVQTQETWPTDEYGNDLPADHPDILRYASHRDVGSYVDLLDWNMSDNLQANYY